jgi:hypothetical protein
LFIFTLGAVTIWIYDLVNMFLLCWSFFFFLFFTYFYFVSFVGFLDIIYCQLDILNGKGNSCLAM